MFYDYVDSGAWTGSTYEANETDFGRIKLRQRVAVDMSNRSLATTMVGQKVSMPVALAPTGIIGMQRGDGEILVARAAEKAGIPYTLSTMSVCSIEDVAENTQKPFWFQLYVMKDRDFIGRLIDRAKKAGCSALVLTLDLQIIGQRHKDIKNGLTTPPRPTLANSQHRDEAAMVPQHALDQAADFRQLRWTRSRRRQHALDVALDRRAV
jgi:L-lactate dehydrogenase (cytochrome)